MRVISAPAELRAILQEHRIQNLSIGLVPTMGALHKGHISLVEQSKKENSVSIVSIFVNPLQFNNQEDLLKYPRDPEEDLEKLKQSGVDYVFTPSENDLYPEKPIVSIDFGQLSEVLEGKFRKNHFEGVGVVVSKLLNIVQPSNAYFGLKDLQQFLLIRRMSSDLNFPTTIKSVPTVRESSGLAMSSRNRRLSAKGFLIASNIFEGLSSIDNGIQQGKDLDLLLKETSNFYESVEGLEIEYLEAVNPDNLESVKSYDDINELAVCVAGYVEGVRLIDNLYLRFK